MEVKRYDMIVVGAGPAGLSAAIEAAKHGVKPIVFDENARPGGQLFKQRFALALEALAVDDIAALLPAPHHHRDELRRVLQIHIDDDPRSALCRVHTAGHRGLMAKVS